MKVTNKRVAYRQGDVTIVAQDRDPDDYFRRNGATIVSPSKGRVVLAEGEVTGHAHAMDARNKSGNLVAALLRPRNPLGSEAVLVVTETTVARGALLEGKVIGTMPGGTIRFELSDGTIMRFAPGDVDITKQGAKVKRAYHPLKHEEHDAIPVDRGVYNVVIQHTATAQQRRRQVLD